MIRYLRQLELNDFSLKDLITLHQKKILIIGMGGLGQPIAFHLLSAGVTHLGIADKDQAEISNLNRQVFIKESDLGRNKVDVVKDELLKRNSDSIIDTYPVFIDKNNIKDIIKQYDLVVDATDNWESKLLINDACHELKIPFMHVGVLGYQGQFALLVNDKDISLRNIIDDEILKEPFDGVFGAMVSIIASMASLATIKYLLGNHCFDNQLIAYDFKKQSVKKLYIK